MRTTSRTALSVALLSLLLLVPLATEPAQAGGLDRYRSGRVYRGAFPDPDVFRLGRLWVAFGTAIARRSLPILTSTNGRVWRADVAVDGLVGAPVWAARSRAGTRRFMATWAPSIGQAANGRWIAAFAAPLRGYPAKRCVGVAVATSVLGPYRNRRRRPLVCPPDQGAIDPDVFSTHGRTYLLWKTEGIPGQLATSIHVRQLARNGQRFRPGSRAHTLLTTARPWEQPLIENPSMIRYRGRLYLFYSGNRWYTRRYAIGYAICRTVLGPCWRPQDGPLLASGGGMVGPGGPSAFVGPQGQLMLAYAAWRAHHVGQQRRLHVATLKVRRHGRLAVVRLFRRG